MDEKEVVKDPETTAGKETENPAGTGEGEGEQEPKTVPYTRFKEVNNELKETKEMVKGLAQTVQQMKAPPQAEKEDDDDEFADPGMKKIKTENKQLRQGVGVLADQNDLLMVRTDPDINQKDYKKLASKIELEVRNQRSQGQFFSRKQIYYWLKGKEGKPTIETPPIKGETQEAPVPETKGTKKKVKLASEKTLAEKEQDLSGKEF